MTRNPIDKILDYVAEKGFPKEYAFEDRKEKYLLLDWIAMQLTFTRSIKAKQMCLTGEPTVISADKCIGCSGCGSGRLGRLALNTNLLSFLLFQCFPLASVPARTGSMLNGSMVFSLLGFILDSEWELRVSTLLYDFSYLSGRREEPGRRASNRESHASVIYYERVQIRGKRQEQLILRQSTPGVKSTMFQTKKQKANLIFLLHEKILKMWRPNGELTSLTWATTILKLTDGEDYKRALTVGDLG
ncbi:hypothetical protein QYF36_024389 [Acer negundo]|nr:hypothetical protein QYF36_013208 [Acer negundo]KAK4839727.1 hypothetical protein QYF36_024389 [Acer negundo]